jgi:hypothetical protein
MFFYCPKISWLSQLSHMLISHKYQLGHPSASSPHCFHTGHAWTWQRPETSILPSCWSGPMLHHRWWMPVSEQMNFWTKKYSAKSQRFIISLIKVMNFLWHLHEYVFVSKTFWMLFLACWKTLVLIVVEKSTFCNEWKKKKTLVFEKLVSQLHEAS